jgi:c-di-GMP-binding flagellar brake protein YcgR
MPRWPRKAQKKAPSEAEAVRLKSLEGEMRKKSQRAWPDEERRRDSRIKEEDKVVIELLTNGQPPAEKTILNALTKDISPGGVRLTTNMLLPVNTLLKVEVVLSRRRRVVQATGIVRWARTIYDEEMFEIGIEFTQISPDDKMLLLEHTYKKRA